jgi:hypothetical protein
VADGDQASEERDAQGRRLHAERKGQGHRGAHAVEGAERSHYRGLVEAEAAGQRGQHAGHGEQTEDQERRAQGDLDLERTQEGDDGAELRPQLAHVNHQRDVAGPAGAQDPGSVADVGRHPAQTLGHLRGSAAPEPQPGKDQRDQNRQPERPPSPRSERPEHAR